MKYLCYIIGWPVYDAELDWRWYLTLCAVPCWICMLLTPFIPESPRWLLNNSDVQRVKKQLINMADWNGVDSSLLHGQLVEHGAIDQNKKGSINALFIEQHFQTTIQVIVIMICVTAGYFGVVLLQSTYLQSIHESMNGALWQLFLCSLSEIPATIVGILIIDHIPRRLLISSSFFIACVCFIGIIFQISNILCVTLMFLARMCLSIANNVLFIYILEYYPTTVRATSLGFNVTLARFAGISSTFIAQDLYLVHSSIIFSICCGISVAVSYLLPVETLGRKLRDDDDEGVEELVHNALNEYDQYRLLPRKSSSYRRRNNLD